MAKVLLSLGSNQDAERVIKSALKELREQFGEVKESPIYESEAVGFDGDNFLNLVVEIATEQTVGELFTALRELEDQHGRDRTQPRFSGRTLDIDILTYDDAVGVVDGVALPRDEILKNAFVLRPLADNWGDWLHPEVKQPYSHLWAAYDKTQQKLWPVTL